MKVEKWAKNGEKGQNSQPLSPARGATPVIEDMTTKLVKAILSMGKVDCDSDAWNKVAGEAQAAAEAVIFTGDTNKN